MPYYNSIQTPTNEELAHMNTDTGLGSVYYDIYYGQFAQPNQKKIYTDMNYQRVKAQAAEESPVILVFIIFTLFFALK
jgi:hypothetical protein